MIYQLFKTQEQFEEWYKKSLEALPEFTKGDEFNTPMDLETIRVAVEKDRAELLGFCGQE